MKFKQMDGSLIGSTPATHLTEPVQLEIGQHRETIWFVVAPKIMEAVILAREMRPYHMVEKEREEWLWGEDTPNWGT